MFDRNNINDLIINNLFIQRKSGKYCDIRLVVGTQFTWVHSAVICSVSPYVCNQYSDSNETCTPGHCLKPKEIKFKSDRYNCFQCLEKIVDFVYGQKIIPDSEHSHHVLDYCNILNLSENLLQSLTDTFSDNQQKINDDIKSECSIKIENSQTDSEDAIENDLNLQTSNSTPCNDIYGITNQRSISPLSLSKSEDSSERSKGKFQYCVECNFKCLKSAILLKHLIQTDHDGKICSLCLTELDNSDELKQHLTLHEHPKPFFCIYCNRRFPSRSLLEQHLPRHMLQKPFTCPHCQKGFKRKYGLKSHLLTHSTEKKHLCDECGFSTIHARVLRSHQLTHTGDLFKCSFLGCNHKSTRKENIKQHLKTHGGEKPFVCELCGLKFTQNKSLRRHSLIHSKKELGNMLCPHCPFKALRIDNLKAHILRRHSGRKSRKDLLLDV